MWHRACFEGVDKFDLIDVLQDPNASSSDPAYDPFTMASIAVDIVPSMSSSSTATAIPYHRSIGTGIDWMAEYCFADLGNPFSGEVHPFEANGVSLDFMESHCANNAATPSQQSSSNPMMLQDGVGLETAGSPSSTNMNESESSVASSASSSTSTSPQLPPRRSCIKSGDHESGIVVVAKSRAQVRVRKRRRVRIFDEEEDEEIDDPSYSEVNRRSKSSPVRRKKRHSVPSSAARTTTTTAATVARVPSDASEEVRENATPTLSEDELVMQPFMNMKTTQLRHELGLRSAPIYGTKHELLERLRIKILGPRSVPNDPPLTALQERLKSVLITRTTDSLRGILRSVGKPIYGNKEMLIGRLMAAGVSTNQLKHELSKITDVTIDTQDGGDSSSCSEESTGDSSPSRSHFDGTSTSSEDEGPVALPSSAESTRISFSELPTPDIMPTRTRTRRLSQVKSDEYVSSSKRKRSNASSEQSSDETHTKSSVSIPPSQFAAARQMDPTTTMVIPLGPA